MPSRVVGSLAQGTPLLHNAQAKPAVSVRTPPPIARAGSALRNGSTRVSSSNKNSMFSMDFSSSFPGAMIGSNSKSTDEAQVLIWSS